MHKRRVVMAAVAVTAAVVAAVVGGGGVVRAAAAGPSCGITWGSLAKGSFDMSGAPIVGARAGRHECFDRLVVDLGGTPAASAYVRYTDGYHAEGSGQTVAVAGGAVLTVLVQAPAYDENYVPTVPWRGANPVVNVDGFSTFRGVVYGGSFEGQTSLGLGVRARLPFRVFALDGPGTGSRLVVDVAHRW